jgi:hypothetical protein
LSGIAVVLVVASLVAVPAVAGAASNSVTLIGTKTSQHQHGKSLSFTENLNLDDTPAAVDKITCNQVSGAVFNCRGRYVLPDGTISVAGRINTASADNQVRITGGTKAYVGAGGTLRLHILDRKRTRETFTFGS